MSEQSDADEAPKIQALSFLVDKSLLFQVRLAELLKGVLGEIRMPQYRSLYAAFAFIPIDNGRVLRLNGSAWSIYQTVREGDAVAIKVADLEYVPSRDQTDPSMRLSIRGRPPWYIALREVGGKDCLHVSCEVRDSFYLYIRIRNSDTMMTCNRGWFFHQELQTWYVQAANNAYPPSKLDESALTVLDGRRRILCVGWSERREIRYF